MSDRVSRSVLEFVTTGVDQVTGAYDKVEQKARQVGGAVTGLSQHVGNLASVFKGFLALEIVSRITQFAGAVVEAVDQFDTLAGRIEDTTDNVQRLQAVSQQYDVTLESLIGGIQELQARLGDPSDEFVKALARVGLTVEHLKAQAPTEAYLSMASALGRIEDAADRAAIAKDTLGKSAKGLANSFREEVDQVEAWIKMRPETIEFVDSMKAKYDQLNSSLLAYNANMAADTFNWQAWSDFGRNAINALLLDAKNFQRYMDSQFSQESLRKLDPGQDPKRAPNLAWAMPKSSFTDIANDLKALTTAENQLTRSARERIEANKEALEVFEDRTRAEREYYNWVGEREIEAVAAAQARLDHEAAAWRQFYNWLGERRMEDEAAVLASHQRIAQSASQMFQSMMASSATWNGTGLGMLRGTVPMHPPGESGGSGWMGRFGSMLGPGLNLLGGMIPGQSQLGSGIGSAIGLGIGSMKKFAESAFGAALGPLGGILGGLAGNLLGKLFGSEAKETRKKRDEWIESVGGMDQLKAAAAAAGVSLDKLFNAKKVKDFEAEAKRVTAQIEKHKQLTAQINELEAERARLVEETTVGYDQMRQVAEQYGIDQGGLGQAFQQKRLGGDAQSLIDAIEVMRRGGADMGTVLFGMRDEISALVRDSAQFGTTIPENLREFIQHLLETGNLLDENGEAMKELPTIKFGEAMASQLEKASSALAKVADQIADLIRQLEQLHGTRADFGVQVPGGSTVTPSGLLAGAAQMPLVSGGIAAARSALGSLSDGGGAASPLYVMMDGQVAARAMIRRTGRTLALAGA